MSDQLFEKLAIMEDLLRKNRGFTYLISRVAGSDQKTPPDQLAAEGIQQLSDEMQHELGQAYVEVFHACKFGETPSDGGAA